MADTFWHKQAAGKPLFPDLLWSRPENRSRAGKLLIVGGNAHSFSAPAEAYSSAERAGIGTVRFLLPDALQKVLQVLQGATLLQGGTLQAEFGASTPSGSFSQRALDELLALAGWADGVLVAGDLGRNAETAILLEKFAIKYPGQLTLTKDAFDYFINLPAILERPDTTLVVSFAQLQKLATAAKFPKPFTFDMDLLRLLSALHDFTSHYRANIIVKHLENIVVAASGQVSATKLANGKETWRVETAAHASVWWLQNRGKSFEALTTSLIAKGT